MYFLKTFILMFCFWLVMSGFFDPFHLTLGIISSLIVAAWSHDLLFQNRGRGTGKQIQEALRFLAYLAWLMYQIFLANLHVVYLAFHPRMKELIDPRIFRYRSRLKKDFSKFVLANSITLTPGTITINISDDEYLIHAITPQAAGDMMGDPADLTDNAAEMERRVAKVFEAG